MPRAESTPTTRLNLLRILRKDDLVLTCVMDNDIWKHGRVYIISYGGVQQSYWGRFGIGRSNFQAKRLLSIIAASALEASVVWLGLVENISPLQHENIDK